MTPAEATLVQSSYRRLQPVSRRVGVLFLVRLFEIDPSLRMEVDRDLAGQSRQFLQALGLAVNGLSHPGMFAPVVRRAGLRRARFFAGPGRMEAVAEALIWSLESAAGEPLPSETRNAWLRAYWFLANLLRAGAREAGLRSPLAA